MEKASTLKMHCARGHSTNLAELNSGLTYCLDIFISRNGKTRHEKPSLVLNNFLAVVRRQSQYVSFPQVTEVFRFLMFYRRLDGFMQNFRACYSICPKRHKNYYQQAIKQQSSPGLIVIKRRCPINQRPKTIMEPGARLTEA